MELMDIAARTKLAPRRLRYAVYHGLVPGVRAVGEGKGVIRRFSQMEAIGLALASVLLEAGLNRSIVKRYLHTLFGPRKRDALKELLNELSPLPQPLYMDFGDSSFLRMRSSVPSISPVFGTGWQRWDGGPAADRDPLVQISIDLAPLWAALRCDAGPLLFMREQDLKDLPEKQAPQPAASAPLKRRRVRRSATPPSMDEQPPQNRP